MSRVGLTGGIASGKTTVAERWRTHGAVVIDADVLAREVVEPGTPALAAIRARFGAGVLTPDGTLDRPALGRLVFGDDEARVALNAIVHPAVRTRSAELEARAPRGSVVVHVIPLLVETGQAGSFDEVVVVDVAPEVQLARLRERDGLDDEGARARVRAQASRADRLAAATIVIPNDGDRATLLRRADEVWARVVTESRSRPV
ncbi:dephospho-CoA kinase [Mariniluteicoccus flavus]